MPITLPEETEDWMVIRIIEANPTITLRDIEARMPSKGRSRSWPLIFALPKQNLELPVCQKFNLARASLGWSKEPSPSISTAKEPTFDHIALDLESPLRRDCSHTGGRGTRRSNAIYFQKSVDDRKLTGGNEIASETLWNPKGFKWLEGRKPPQKRKIHEVDQSA